MFNCMCDHRDDLALFRVEIVWGREDRRQSAVCLGAQPIDPAQNSGTAGSFTSDISAPVTIAETMRKLVTEFMCRLMGSSKNGDFRRIMRI
jgi:hypothetical protein